MGELAESQNASNDVENENEEDVDRLNLDKQQTVDIHTDNDYEDSLSGPENNDNTLDDGDYVIGQKHKRSGSMAEKRESIAQQKAAMEAKLRTLSQQLDQNLDGALDEFAEMELINEDKTIFGDLFDKIDPDDNGDVDEKEWIAGLHRLNVGIAESDMAKLFKLMDGDKSGYIDRQDWITFCMTSYQSPELQRLHDSVLMNVKGHSRKPSNMFHAGDTENWSNAAIANLENQMTQAFLKQGADEIQHQEEEEEYFVEMEKEAATNPDWAKPERALEWTPKEVAFWLDTIELSQYARKFDEEQLDGSILLNDCDKTLLQIEMNIKPLHVGKILREVDKLRKINKDSLQDSYKDWNELIEENKLLLQRLESQNNVIKDLQTENAELRLKAISNVDLQTVANPFDGGNALETTKDPNYDDLKTDNDPYQEIKILNEEIERLYKQKMQFAEKAADEMCKLNKIIKVLSSEYTTLSTPYYKKFNPVDSIIRSLGYTPN